MYVHFTILQWSLKNHPSAVDTLKRVSIVLFLSFQSCSFEAGLPSGLGPSVFGIGFILL